MLVKIRPTSEGERQTVEKAYMGTLFTSVDKDAVEERYARLKTRNGTRTLKKITRDLEAGSRSVTINRSFTGGARYRVLLEIVDDAGNVQNRTVNFTGAYR